MAFTSPPDPHSIEPRMQVVACSGHRALALEERATPQPSAGEVLIRVDAAGLCGSDIERLDSGEPRWLGRVLGHEVAGTIAAVGEATPAPAIGTPVVLAPLMPCFACEACEQGRYSSCGSYSFIGSRRDGGFATYLLAPVRNVVELPHDLPSERAVFVEPLTVALHALRNLDAVLGSTVLVTGAGTIGLLAVQAVRAMGCRHVVVSDPDSAKRALAKQLGATVLLDPTNDGDRATLLGTAADIVLECSGANPAKADAIMGARPGGHVELVGTTASDIHLPAAVMEAVTRRELTLRGSWMSYSAPFPGPEWRNAVWLLHSEQVKVDALVTHRFTLSEAHRVAATAFDGNEAVVKVLLTPAPSGAHP